MTKSNTQVINIVKMINELYYQGDSSAADIIKLANAYAYDVPQSVAGEYVCGYSQATVVMSRNAVQANIPELLRLAMLEINLASMLKPGVRLRDKQGNPVSRKEWYADMTFQWKKSLWLKTMLAIWITQKDNLLGTLQLLVEETFDRLLDSNKFFAIVNPDTRTSDPLIGVYDKIATHIATSIQRDANLRVMINAEYELAAATPLAATLEINKRLLNSRPRVSKALTNRGYEF